MKKIILLSMLFIASLSLFAQENNYQEEVSKNELKINMFNIIALKWIDINYERIINEESSWGIGTLISLDNEIEVFDGYRSFSLTPYYRHFFSSKYAKGFFVEAFGMLHSGKEDTYYSNSEPYDSYKENNFTDFAVGISAGAKFVSKRGFVAEIYLGIGRDILNESDVEVVSRGGISIGKRF